MPARTVGADQIALRQHDQVGAGELVLEHFLDRIVVIEGVIGRPLRGNRILDRG